MADRAFQTQPVRFGGGGLNLRPRVDAVPPNQFTRLRNGFRLNTGSFTGRPGQTVLTDAIVAHIRNHSIGRLNVALTNDFQRFWGVDTDLYFGKTGALTLADSGFSGDPLTMLGADPPIPGEPWMYIADSLRMRKIRSDGLDLEIGLPPGVLVSTTPASATLRVDIEDFESSVGWTGYAGDGGGNVPTISTIGGMVGNAQNFQTDPGAAVDAYTSFADKAIGPLDLSTFGLSVPILDSAFMHFWALCDLAALDAVVTIYLISGTFTTGAQPDQGGGNDSGFHTSLTGQAAGVWKEYGIPGASLTKGDFVPGIHGGDWSNITGISVVITVPTPVVVNVALDDFYVYATATPGTLVVPYDYRVTNYDTRTGVEGNGSPIQPSSAWIIDPLDVVYIQPQAYGDADIRQRAYRRGGTLPDNWRLVGENTVNGGVIADSSDDEAIANAPTLQIDHDQPVTSIDADGNALLNQPMPILFGPVNGLFYLLGDPRRPNGVYQSLPDRPDYWPANFFFAVTAAGEPLQTGCVWGGEGYVASNARWFRLIPNLQDASILTAQPTGATKGPITRWAMCVGPDGVYFCGEDGLYRHTGGPQENLTDAEMYPLFNGETKNGYAPIDFSNLRQLRMSTVLNLIRLQYADTNGDTQYLVFDCLTREWRIETYGVDTAVAVGEIENPSTPPKLLIFGSGVDGASFTNTGTSDNGVAIPVNVRTAAMDQGFARNPKQYGDVVVKYAPMGVVIDVQALLDDEGVALAAQSLPPPGAVTRLESLNPFGDTPTEGRNICLDFSWSTTGAPPILDLAGVSYFIQPDITATRISDWDDGGAPGEKYFKGAVLDCDTGGVDKTIVVEGTLYGGAVTTIATLTVNAAGRRKLTFTWPRQAVTLVRIRPTDADTWTRWAWQWIFDEEPLALARWETEPLDLAIPGWKLIPEMWLTLRSAFAITLTVTAFYDSGASVVETYAIPSTAGVKRSFRQTLRAGKGVLYSFLFTTDDGSLFRLYREETHVLVKSIAASDYLSKHPFGNDDLDLVRGVQSAEGTALAPGGGQG